MNWCRRTASLNWPRGDSLRTMKSAAQPANASYTQWHAALADDLPSTRYPQKPQIQGSAQARNRAVFT